MKKSVYKLNPQHERYRECKECKKPFMTVHLSREFCGAKCKQEYNNRLSREKEKGRQQVTLVETLEVNSHLEKLAANIQLFDYLNIPPEGRVYQFENIVAAGAYFPAYSEKVRNLMPFESYSYYYGPYLVLHLENNQLLIIKTKENEKLN